MLSALDLVRRVAAGAASRRSTSVEICARRLRRAKRRSARSRCSTSIARAARHNEPALAANAVARTAGRDQGHHRHGHDFVHRKRLADLRRATAAANDDRRVQVPARAAASARQDRDDRVRLPAAGQGPATAQRAHTGRLVLRLRRGVAAGMLPLAFGTRPDGSVRAVPPPTAELPASSRRSSCIPTIGTKCSVVAPRHDRPVRRERRRRPPLRPAPSSAATCRRRHAFRSSACACRARSPVAGGKRCDAGCGRERCTCAEGRCHGGRVEAAADPRRRLACSPTLQDFEAYRAFGV